MRRQFTTEERVQEMARRVEVLVNQAARLGGQLPIDFGTRCEEVARKWELDGHGDLKYSLFSDHSVTFHLPIWACDATVSIKFKGYDATDFAISAVTEISWGSTPRNLGNASTTVALYTRAVEFASIVEGLFAR